MRVLSMLGRVDERASDRVRARARRDASATLTPPLEIAIVGAARRPAHAARSSREVTHRFVPNVGDAHRRAGPRPEHAAARRPAAASTARRPRTCARATRAGSRSRPPRRSGAQIDAGAGGRVSGRRRRSRTASSSATAQPNAISAWPRCASSSPTSETIFAPPVALIALASSTGTHGGLRPLTATLNVRSSKWPSTPNRFARRRPHARSSPFGV